MNDLMSIFTKLVSLAIVFAIALTVIKSIAYVVKEKEVVIIERLGKFKKIVYQGFHLRLPLLDRIASRVNMKTMELPLTIDAKTKDNVTVTIKAAAQFKVCNSAEGVYKAHYSLQDPEAQIKSYIVDALRSAIPAYSLDLLFENKDDIAKNVNDTVSGKVSEYGYTLDVTLITSIGLPKDVEESMNEINSAQRKKQAAQSLAEAEKIKVVTEAEAKAESMQKFGEGIANQRKAIADGIASSLATIKAAHVSSEEANKLFMFTQYTDMMEKFAESGRTSTVVLPSNFNETASMFEQMTVANAAENEYENEYENHKYKNEEYETEETEFIEEAPSEANDDAFFDPQG